MGYTNLYETLKLHRGSIFAPAEPTPGMPCVLYFPGCGGALFYDRIGVSSIMLLLKAGFAVAVPPRHMCCGFPLLAAGMDTAFEDNMAQNRQYLASMLRNLAKQGFDCKHLVTACGSCRDGLERLHMETQFPQLTLRDVGQLTLPLLDKDKLKAPCRKAPRFCTTARVTANGPMCTRSRDKNRLSRRWATSAAPRLRSTLAAAANRAWRHDLARYLQPAAFAQAVAPW